MENYEQMDERIKARQKLYARGSKIISPFANEEINKHYRLFFEDGTQIIALYINSGDGDNGLDLDDPDFEDLFEFYFIIKRIEEKGTTNVFKENEGIVLNYHNFFEKFDLYEGEI